MHLQSKWVPSDMNRKQTINKKGSNMKTIMCFGDSNTFGEKPNYLGERYPWGERWTSLLQEALGYENFHVYENGYNGRTTVFTDPYDPLRNGLKGMRYALATHRQIDLITQVSQKKFGSNLRFLTNS